MRVLQLIDSLDPGGAERVSVNMANALVNKIEKSFLCTTRGEGILKSSIDTNVGYFFLEKKAVVDIKAINLLNKIVRNQKIDIIHAHSTSFFLAVIIKLINKNIKIVWHDHYGNSEFLKDRKSIALKFCSKYFNYVLSVNRNLANWSRNYLKIENVSYLPNFVVDNKIAPQTTLFGAKGKRIICLANLRPQKDHITLIKAFNKVIDKYPEWTLHLVGKDFKDDYSFIVKNEIESNNLNKSIFLYGSKPDISNILSQCEIGLLSSKSEGLPIALLEYGLAKLAVISTNVGECKSVIKNKDNGILVKPEDEYQLFEAIQYLIKKKEERIQKSKAFNLRVLNVYSQKVVIGSILNIYINILNVT